MAYVITAKGTYQTSEDTMERLTISLLVNGNTTMDDISAWIKQKRADTDTIQLHIPENIEEVTNEQ